MRKGSEKQDSGKMSKVREGFKISTCSPDGSYFAVYHNSGHEQIGYLRLQQSDRTLLDDIYICGAYLWLFSNRLVCVAYEGGTNLVLLEWSSAGLLIHHRFHTDGRTWIELFGTTEDGRIVLLERYHNNPTALEVYLTTIQASDSLEQVDPRLLRQPLAALQRNNRGRIWRGPEPVGEYLSPNKRYIARVAYGEGEVVVLSIWKKESIGLVRQSPDLIDVTSFGWVSDREIVAGTSHIYGERAGLYVWHSNDWEWKLTVDKTKEVLSVTIRSVSGRRVSLGLVNSRGKVVGVQSTYIR